jgi:RecJ-like exonuclease
MIEGGIMPKCERCGLNGDVSEIKICPEQITDWANKPICKQCYLELKKNKRK